ncbi:MULTISPECIES: PH domain-containing protein [unclassified Streptomyces]|uniref:PH domain-containing protein n=1 Tax=unclassified Streptomyces TaxID=2593676 RepID=UPI0003717EE5|nr:MULTISPECIES: PH domain-containing protein [unclassified Streptomyces]MYT33367.1 PH domain-containing protein [Streptomyces sp. SID8354]
MTRPEPSTSSRPQYAERSYRPPAALAGGVLLILLGLWLGGDALLRGTVHTKLTAAFALLLVVPLVAAFSLRPLVRANEDRLLVRNPFRTITLPWAAVEDLRARFSAEVFVNGGGKYQLWAVPVSLRQRKKAARQASRGPGANRPRFGLHADAGPAPKAMADQTLAELHEIKERATGRETAQGAPQIRWSYAILAPALAGAVGLAVMVAL